MTTYTSLREEIATLLARPYEEIDERDVETLALRVFAWQRAHNPVLARVADATLDGREAQRFDDIVGVPTDVFKVARVACFSETETVRTFRTSGTTREVRGLHAFCDLSLYELAAMRAGARWLLPERAYACVFLAPSEWEAPDSSLAYMLARFHARWGDARVDPFVIRAQRIDLDAVKTRVSEAVATQTPVALLGASYGFVHLFDGLGASRLALPPGSVVMPTGGFKGRSREVEPAAFHAMLQEHLGVMREQIVGEYGMTELSSQAYEAHREGVSPGVFRAPPWMRVNAVDPDRLTPLPQGEVGLLRVVDLANLGSALAIQTADLGRVTTEGFEVLGRAPGATPRGCARALDAALSGEP